MKQPSFHDVELLSAYLDGQMSQIDSARLEARLKADPQLRSIYDDLQQARALLRKLPARRAPRNFTLTPRMAGIKPPLPRVFPFFRLASTLAAILFFISFAVNLSVPAVASLRAAAPAPAFGMGGGGGGPELPAASMANAPTEAAPEATEAAAQDNFAPTPAPERTTTTLVAPAESGAAADTQEKSIPYNRLPYESVSLPVPAGWMFGLLALAALSGGAALFVRLKAEQDWRKANAAKPRKVTARNILIAGLVALALLLLAAVIYWMSSATFYAPVAIADDSGPVLGADKGNVPTPVIQNISLVPGTGYNFSTTDSQGLVTAVDFPSDAVKEETPVMFIPGLNTIPPEVTFFAKHAFTLVPAPKSTVLQAPITITIDYAEETVSTLNEAKLALYWWSGQEWRDAASTCSPTSAYERILESNRIRVPVCQMGSFVLVVP